MNHELIELVKENPELPVFAWVDSDVVSGDDYGRWLGEFGPAKRARIVCRDLYGEDRIIEYEDRSEIVEYLAENDEAFEDKTEAEITDYVEKLPWKDCILVYIGTPDSVFREGCGSRMDGDES